MSTRLCIVTPGSLGSNPRVVKEADTLAARGYDVTVVAMRTLAAVDDRDDAILKARSWRGIRVDMRSRLRRWPFRSVQLIAARLYKLLRVRSLADLSVQPSVVPLALATLPVKADLYIAHYPGALPAAALAARWHKAKLAYDAEDLHPEDLPDEPAHAGERDLITAVEGRYLPQCAYVSAAAPLIADGYAEIYGIPRPTVILNTFPASHRPERVTLRGETVPAPSIYWFSQSIGPDRGLEAAVRAIGLARTSPHLFLRGSMAAGYGRVLAATIADAGVLDRVHILPPALPQDLERLASAYDLAICSETGWTGSRRACLPNKIFSFLLAGVPPLMTETPAQQAFAAEAGLTDLLYPIDNAPALAALMDRFLSDPQLLSQARARAWALGSFRYTWEQDEIEFLRCIRLVVEGPDDAISGVPLRTSASC